jgi:mannose-1-phosphate guanylyltransferase
MSPRANAWAVVLAAGDGRRLATLTTDARGESVPKQFCSLNGGDPLILETVARARSVAPPDHICTVLAAQHRRHWRRLPLSRACGRLIVQPENRGTAHGILLAVLSVLAIDPLAHIVFLPADHYVRDEAALGASLQSLANIIAHHPEQIAMLGIAPEQADPELGYILPGLGLADGSHTVARFFEKPEMSVARELIDAGALWNSFIFGASGLTLLALLSRALGDTVEAMGAALARDSYAGVRGRSLANLYAALPPVDFSRAVMQGAEALLRVVPTSACGWSDLGTPERVAATLRRLRRTTDRDVPRSQLSSMRTASRIDLATQHARLGLAV